MAVMSVCRLRAGQHCGASLNVWSLSCWVFDGGIAYGSYLMGPYALWVFVTWASLAIWCWKYIPRAAVYLVADVALFA